ncbi:hypothetical protein HYV88_00375 [Candidatus Woesearchaeota archaeon]|nr:hypothetical protein [Candidatus Woesearchaeota archaeon]
MDRQIKVEIKSKDGLRYGDLEYEDCIEKFPKQIITSTNEGHIRNFDEDIDLDTKAFQVFLNLSLEELNDNFNSKSKLNKIRIAKNFINIPKRINWILTKSFFNTPRVSIKDLENSLKLQEQIGCKLKALYIPKNIKPKLAIPILNENIDSVIYLDMNDLPTEFKELYLHYLKIGIKIICFIIRQPSEKNVENYNFIAGRPEDNILRLATQLTKRSIIAQDKALSIFYYILGFDGFAFRGGQRPSYNTAVENLAIYRRGAYKFESIESFDSCSCKSHKGSIPYDKAIEYHEQKKSSIPSSLHDHIELNEDFAEIRRKIIEGEIKIEGLKEKIDFDSTMKLLLERKRTKKKN